MAYVEDEAAALRGAPSAVRFGRGRCGHMSVTARPDESGVICDYIARWRSRFVCSCKWVDARASSSSYVRCAQLVRPSSIRFQAARGVGHLRAWCGSAPFCFLLPDAASMGREYVCLSPASTYMGSARSRAGLVRSRAEASGRACASWSSE